MLCRYHGEIFKPEPEVISTPVPQRTPSPLLHPPHEVKVHIMDASLSEDAIDSIKEEGLCAIADNVSETLTARLDQKDPLAEVDEDEENMKDKDDVESLIKPEIALELFTCDQVSKCSRVCSAHLRLHS